MYSECDWPYIGIVLLLALLMILEGVKEKPIYYRLSVLLVLLFIGLRAPVVGADTWNYYRYFTGERSFYNDDSRALEFLFPIYNKVVGWVFMHIGVLYMLWNTFFSLFFVEKIVAKYSSYKTLSVLSFFLLYNYSMYFVTLRQVIGLSFLFFAILYVLENRKYKWGIYGLTTFVAYNFHTSCLFVAAIILILYFVPLKNRIIPLGLIVSTAVIGILLKSFDLDYLINLYLMNNFEIGERVDSYIVNSDVWMSDETTQLSIILRPTILSSIIVLFLNREQMGHWFTKIYIFSVCFYNLFNTMTIVLRLNTGLSIFVIVLITWSFPYIVWRKSAFILKKSVMIIVLLYFLRSYIIQNSTYDLWDLQRMHPYYFFFEDYSDHPSLRW